MNSTRPPITFFSSQLRRLLLLLALIASNVAFFATYVHEYTVPDMQQYTNADTISKTMFEAPGIGNPDTDIKQWLLAKQPALFSDAQDALLKPDNIDSDDDAETLTRYFYFIGRTDLIKERLIQPLIAERLQLAEPELREALDGIPRIRASLPDDRISRLDKQKEFADAIMKELRYTVLLAAYLHERLGHGEVALAYYNHYLEITTPIVYHFDYFKSGFAQKSRTLALTKAEQLKVTVSATRGYYHSISYFNWLLERRFMEAWASPIFSVYITRNIVGGTWGIAGPRGVGRFGDAVGDDEEAPPQASLHRLIQLRDRYAAREDPFLHYEVCAALWSLELTELRDRHCPPARISSLANQLKDNKLLYSFLKMLPVRASRQPEEKAELLLALLADKDVADFVKDDSALRMQILLSMRHAKGGGPNVGLTTSRQTIQRHFPFGKFDAAPASLGIDYPRSFRN